MPAIWSSSPASSGGWTRDPTDVELFQIAQANSEHSRHWVFKGELWVDGARVPEKHLMDIVRQPLGASGPNSVIAFRDDSSAIRGRGGPAHGRPSRSGRRPSRTTSVLLHPTLTAETHNFPSGVAPYPGAATGAGGRIRDNQAVGRGGLVCASGAAYCMGNLHIPGYPLPWEEDGYSHPPDLASPLDILIEASNGASDYGNCFGEPLIYGFTRTLRPPVCPTATAPGTSPSCTAWGRARSATSTPSRVGRTRTCWWCRWAARPTASAWAAAPPAAWSRARTSRSWTSTPSSAATLRWSSGSTGLYGRAWSWAKPTPSSPLHDLGAGGDCNALPEIVEPAGAVIDLRAIPVGDQTLSVLEIWGNESQERNALLVLPAKLQILETHGGARERPAGRRRPGDGRRRAGPARREPTTPGRSNCPWTTSWGTCPRRGSTSSARPRELAPLVLPPPASDFRRVLDLVLRLPAIGSKRFLTNKVDLDVTGLVIQRQLVGPRHLPLSDYAAHRADLRRPLRDRPQPGRAAAQGTHQAPGRAPAWPWRRRSSTWPGVGGLRHHRDQVLGQLDAGGQAARRRGLALRRGLRAAGHPDGAGHGHRRRQGQPFHGQPGHTRPMAAASWSRLRRSW